MGKTLNDDRASVTSALRGFRKCIEPAREHLVALIGELHKVLDAQLHSFDNEEEIVQLALSQEQDRFIAATGALERLDHAVAKIYQRRTRRVGNLWRIAFAKSLFACWWRLTGCDPSPVGPFCDFLDAAISSLTDQDLDQVTWERTVRTAKSHVQREFGETATPWRVDFVPVE